ncbi:unnamed protein product, partial [Amoebophrya sp. A25]|eukprot:GSA25T00001293001.1
MQLLPVQSAEDAAAGATQQEHAGLNNGHTKVDEVVVVTTDTRTGHTSITSTTPTTTVSGTSSASTAPSSSYQSAVDNVILLEPLILIPLVWVRRLAKLDPAMIFGDVTIMGILLCLFSYGIWNLVFGGAASSSGTAAPGPVVSVGEPSSSISAADHTTNSTTTPPSEVSCLPSTASTVVSTASSLLAQSPPGQAVNPEFPPPRPPPQQPLSSLPGAAVIWIFNASSWGLALGTCIFTFEGIGGLLPVQASMKQPDSFLKVYLKCITGIGLAFSIFGTAIYASSGGNVPTNAILTLPLNNSGNNAAGPGGEASPNSGSTTGSATDSTFLVPIFSLFHFLTNLSVGRFFCIMYGLGVLASYPLVLFPAVRVLENYIFPKPTVDEHEPTDEKLQRELEASKGQVRELKRELDQLKTTPPVATITLGTRAGRGPDDSRNTSGRTAGTSIELAEQGRPQAQGRRIVQPGNKTNAGPLDLQQNHLHPENTSSEVDKVEVVYKGQFRWQKNFSRAFVVLCLCTIAFFGAAKLDIFVSMLGAV